MINRFFKDSLFYVLAGVFTKGIGLILLPIYTVFLTKEQFGALDYLTAIGAVLAVVVSLEISQGLLRYVVEDTTNEKLRRSYVSSALGFTLLSYLIVFIIIYTLSERIAIFLFDEAQKSELILIAFGAYFGSGMVYILIMVLRAKLQAIKAVFFSMLSAISIAIFSLILLVIFELGLKGILLGQLLGGFVASMFIAYSIRADIELRIDKTALGAMLSFSAPLVFSSIGVVLSIFSDRFFIKEIIGLEAVAVYGVAIRVASIVSLLVMGFQSALAPLILSSYKKKATPLNIAKLFHIFLVISLLLVFFIEFFAEEIINLFAGEKYIEASAVTSLLALAILVQGMYIFFPGLTIAKKTSVLATTNAIGAIVNITLNIAAIRIWGVYGAAFATLLSAIVVLMLNVFYSSKYYKIPINVYWVVTFTCIIGLQLSGNLF